MSISEYLFLLETKRLLLMAGCLAQGDTRGLLYLSRWADIRCCCSPHNHRAEWVYRGDGHFTCSICERMQSSVA
jgi:hypothetical protein